VPSNIGVPGQAVQDSLTTNILDALKQATDCEVVIIDLEDGRAWWETRLLVLLAGAVKLEGPNDSCFWEEIAAGTNVSRVGARPADF
jgi:hypothetical protein